MQIPIVDYRQNDAPARFIKSIRETGFGVITNTFVTKEMIADAYQEWRSFFTMDQESKNKFKFDPEHQSGYFPMLSEKAKGAKVADLKEFIHHYPNRTTNIIKTSAATNELCLALEDLAIELLEWLEDAAPADAPKDWGSMVDKSVQTLYRVIHYPPLADHVDGAVRAAAHEDINLITLLPAATGAGLEVLDKNGNWHKVGTDASSIIINVGDMLQLMTKDFYPSTTHRVVNPEGELAKQPRFSMPLFLHPHSNTQLSPEKTAGQYLNERLKELGLI